MRVKPMSWYRIAFSHRSHQDLLNENSCASVFRALWCCCLPLTAGLLMMILMVMMVSVHRGPREPGCLVRQCVGSHCFVPGKSQPSLAALLSNWQTDQRGEMPKVYSVLFQTRRPKWYQGPEKLPSINKSCKFFKVNITQQKLYIILPLPLS